MVVALDFAGNDVKIESAKTATAIPPRRIRRTLAMAVARVSASIM
jgi:hypothetical protein